MAHHVQPKELGTTSADFGLASVISKLNLAAAISSLGGMTFGYDLGALSGAAKSLADDFALSPVLLGLTISISLWGAVCASLFAGRLADSLGRRSLLAACASLYALTSFGLAWPAHFHWGSVVVLRFLSGIAVGGFVVDCPLYLAEIAPRALRGRFVGWFQLQVGAGVVLAFVASAALAHRIPETDMWKWCFGLGGIPSLLLLALLFWVPEGPHWLAGQGRWHDAAVSAARLGFPVSDWPRQGSATIIDLPSPTSQEKLFRRKYLRPLLLAASIALFNQLSGVNILRIYLLDLLTSSGMGRLTSHSYSILISCLNLVALLMGMTFVDKLGRKPLLVAGSAGMAFCMLALNFALRHHAAAVSYLVILVSYNSFFAFSQGAVAWVYLSELFPFSVRGKGQGFGALIHWIANAGLILAFPLLQHAAPQGSFLLFAFMMALQVAIVILWYPETKGTHIGAVAEAAN